MVFSRTGGILRPSKLTYFLTTAFFTAVLPGAARLSEIQTSSHVAGSPATMLAATSAPGSHAPAALSLPPDVVLPTEVDAAGVAAGNTTGALQVSSDGDLTYTLPLWVPPGRNGMQPQLSLSYRGRGGNGLVGVGWSLGGLSQIIRCPQNFAENGKTAAVGFSNDDRFCLDGQQLVPLAGANGADNTEYRTEHDGFAKIVSGGSGCAGADDKGPTCFRVFLKGGRILTYGQSGSNINAGAIIQGQRIARTVPDPTQLNAVTDTSQIVRYGWALARAEDRFGNGINYNYKLAATKTSDGLPTFEFLPQGINYTDNGTLVAHKSVVFDYENRPDPKVFYVSGFRMTSTMRLSSIEASGPDPVEQQVLRSYKLAYRNDSITHRSLPWEHHGLRRPGQVQIAAYI